MQLNMNFYSFVNKQILILIILTLLTAPGYVYMSGIYTQNLDIAFIWFATVALLSIYGVLLYYNYTRKNLNHKEKEIWFLKARIFLYAFFSMWTMMFLISIESSIVEMHYIAIAAQLGASIVSATLLVSQRKLSTFTLISLMVPLVVYFLMISAFYAYLLAFFTVVLCGVLIYAAHNTNSYLNQSRYQAYHDYLTKLGNRHFFIERFEDAMKAESQKEEYLSLILMDLDNFKSVNDSLGHDIGDELLVEVARRMMQFNLKNNYTIARLGGDEFCILSMAYTTQKECVEQTENFAKLLLDAIKEIYIIQGHYIYISASIGISIIGTQSVDASRFLKEADIAMYEAKLQGRDGVILFTQELSKKIEKKLEIERLLHFALKNNEIYLMYQPQLDVNSKVRGCEVLVRWKSSKLGMISPDEFIPISEENGLIIELGEYILEESFKTLLEWSQKGILLEQFSINISMRQLFHESFINKVKMLTEKYLNGDLCTRVIFEITETSVADNIEKLISVMSELKKLGIRFSMDDFGTGYSSLNHLRRLPFDELKIDKSFLLHLHEVEQDKTMIKTILNIAKSLQLSVVAEGVEDRSQKEFLAEHECDIFQGFFFSKPILKEEFVAYLK